MTTRGRLLAVEAAERARDLQVEAELQEIKERLEPKD